METRERGLGRMTRIVVEEQLVADCCEEMLGAEGGGEEGVEVGEQFEADGRVAAEIDGGEGGEEVLEKIEGGCRREDGLGEGKEVGEEGGGVGEVVEFVEVNTVVEGLPKVSERRGF